MDANGDLVSATRTTPSGPYRAAAVTNTIDTLNLSLDATPDAVYGGLRDYLNNGNTIVVQSGAGAVNSQIMAEDLTVKANAHSADLNLTLATHYADASAIPNGGVHNLTLADYDTVIHLGANVDVTGNELANVITGNSGNNTLAGGAGADTLIGGAGGDTMMGGGGNDTFKYVVGDGSDTIDGGADTDTLDYTGSASAVIVDLCTNTATGIASLTSIENVTGGSAGDTLTGNSGDNILTGGGGNDTIDGGGGIDTAVYTGSVTVTASGGGWSVNGGVGEGTDTLSNVEVINDAGSGNILLVGNGGYDTIQAAITAAANGDTIIVAPGTWALPSSDGGKQLTFLGANAGISANDANGDLNDAGRGPETILDGTGLVNLNFRFESGSGTFDGFTFTNLHFDSYVAGGDIAFLNNVIPNPGSGQLLYSNSADTVTIAENHVTGVVAASNFPFVQLAGDWDGTSGTTVSITGNVIRIRPAPFGASTSATSPALLPITSSMDSTITHCCSPTTATSM